MVRQLAPNRATQVSFYRLLANPAVMVERQLDAQAEADGLGAVTGHGLGSWPTRRPLDLRCHAGRLRPDTVGPLSSASKGLGLFLHRLTQWLERAGQPTTPGVITLTHGGKYLQ